MEFNVTGKEPSKLNFATFDKKRMMPLHQYYIQDNSVRETSLFLPGPGIEIYEVVRVQEGVPLFAEDHLARFYHSAWLCHLEIPWETGEIVSCLDRLIQANGVSEGNIRFSWSFSPEGVFRAYFIPHRYPDMKMVETGVTCGLLNAERHDPNAKVVQMNVRETADKMIREEGYYEVLLVNRNGEITEGSRSNLFFLKNGELVTSPEKEVLPGITRQKVIGLAHSNSLGLSYQSIKVDKVVMMEGAFLTGTSPKVLPVRKIGNVDLSVGQQEIKQMVLAYDELVGNYIKNNR